jgi:hypothetical protein
MAMTTTALMSQLLQASPYLGAALAVVSAITSILARHDKQQALLSIWGVVLGVGWALLGVLMISMESAGVFLP